MLIINHSWYGDTYCCACCFCTINTYTENSALSQSISSFYSLMTRSSKWYFVAVLRIIWSLWLYNSHSIVTWSLLNHNCVHGSSKHKTLLPKIDQHQIRKSVHQWLPLLQIPYLPVFDPQQMPRRRAVPLVARPRRRDAIPASHTIMVDGLQLPRHRRRRRRRFFRGVWGRLRPGRGRQSNEYKEENKGQGEPGVDKEIGGHVMASGKSFDFKEWRPRDYWFKYKEGEAKNSGLFTISCMSLRCWEPANLLDGCSSSSASDAASH